MPKITGESGNDKAAAGGTATKEKASKTRAPSTRTKAGKNEKVARQYFDALIAHDPDGMAACWHEDGIEDIVPVGIFRGPNEVKQLFTEMFAAVPDLEMIVDRVVANADSASVLWRMSGTFSGGAFQGIEPTGKRVELRGCDVLDIEDGKIKRNTAFYDGAAFARGIGMLPPKDSGGERAMMAAFNATTKLRSRIAAARSR